MNLIIGLIMFGAVCVADLTKSGYTNFLFYPDMVAVSGDSSSMVFKTLTSPENRIVAVCFWESSKKIYWIEFLNGQFLAIPRGEKWDFSRSQDGKCFVIFGWKNPKRRNFSYCPQPAKWSEDSKQRIEVLILKEK